MSIGRLTVVAIIGLMIGAACGGNGNSSSTPATETVSPADTPSPDQTELPTLDPAFRLTVEPQYDELTEAQEAIAKIWQDLQAGQGVACNTELPVLPSPDVYRGEGEAAGFLFEAAINLQEAYRLWNTECLNPRPEPPPTVIDQGLRAALSAGDRLQEVRAILTR